MLETEHRSSAKAVFIVTAEPYLCPTYIFKKISIFTKNHFLKKHDVRISSVHTFVVFGTKSLQYCFSGWSITCLRGASLELVACLNSVRISSCI